MIDKEGKILVNEEGFLKLAADGHGGVFESMLKSGILQDMNDKGVEWVFIGPVDNPLVNMVDPIFVAIALPPNLWCLLRYKKDSVMAIKHHYRQSIWKDAIPMCCCG